MWAAILMIVVAQIEDRPAGDPVVPAMGYSVRSVRQKSRTHRYTLLHHGRPTPVSMEIQRDDESNILPSLTAWRTRSGLEFGKLESYATGAISTTLCTSFVSYQGRAVRVDEAWPSMVRNGRILFMPVPLPGWTQTEPAQLYSAGRLQRVSPAAKANLEANGTVTGWYYSNADRTPYPGIVGDQEEPVFQQYFRWKSGKRTLLGRIRLKADRGPSGTRTPSTMS